MAKKLLRTEEEIILVLALYFYEGQTQLPEDHPKVQHQSNLLRSFNIYPVEEREDNFRNPNSVHIRLGGFLSLDPKYVGEGMKGSKSKIVQAVWDTYSHDLLALFEAAKAIENSRTPSRSIGNIEAFQEVTPLDEEEFREGDVIMEEYLERQRSSQLVAKKKRQVLNSSKGRLICEVCEFDFVETYGEIGQNFAECHHRVPLSELKDETNTKLADLAVVCANCHRMLHTARSVLTVEALRKIVLDRRLHRES